MDVIQVVEKLDSLGYIRANRVINNYYSIHCPFHNGGNEKKPSFGILLREERRNGQRYPEGWCHCFACGHVSTLPEMITKLFESRSISKSGYDWLVENIPEFSAEAEFDYLIPQDTMSQINNNFAIDYIQTHQQLAGQTYVSEEELQSYRFTVPYMYERKLTDEIIDRFDIGYDGNWVPPGRKRPVPCITFPVRDKQGRTLFLCRRSIEGKLYNYPEGVTKPLYGIDMVPANCKSLIICESCINALTAWTWGYPAVALLGTGNSYQIQQIRELGVPEVVICMDGDEAGQKATNRLKRALSRNCIVWSINMLPGKDINDLDKTAFEALYADRE